jgi:hypothetical protein
MILYKRTEILRGCFNEGWDSISVKIGQMNELTRWHVVENNSLSTNDDIATKSIGLNTKAFLLIASGAIFFLGFTSFDQSRF